MIWIGYQRQTRAWTNLPNVVLYESTVTYTLGSIRGIATPAAVQCRPRLKFALRNNLVERRRRHRRRCSEKMCQTSGNSSYTDELKNASRICVCHILCLTWCLFGIKYGMNSIGRQTLFIWTPAHIRAFVPAQNCFAADW